MKGSMAPQARPAGTKTPMTLARILSGIAHVLESGVNAGDRIRHVLEQFRHLVAYDRCALLAVVPDGHDELTVMPGTEGLELDRLRAVLEHLRGMLLDDDIRLGEAPIWDGLPDQQRWRSRLAVPLVGLDDVIGVLAVGRDAPDVYDEQDLQVLSIVAAQLASYLTALRARQQELVQEQMARTSAENELRQRRRSESAQRFLSEASVVLGRSLDCESALGEVAALAAAQFGSWCVLDLLEDHSAFRRVALAGPGAGRAEHAPELFRRHSPAGSHPIWRVVRDGETLVTGETTEPLLRPVIGDAPESIGPGGLMMAPMRVQAQTIGVLTLTATESQRRYGPEDLALVEELAHRCAMAVDNARSYRESEAHRLELQTVLSSMAEGVLSLDASLRIVEANPCAGRMLGVPPQSLRRRMVNDVVRLTDENDIQEHDLAALIGTCIEEGESRHVEQAWLKLPRGRRLPVAVTMSPRRVDGGPVGTVVLFRNITRQREVDEMRDNIISLVSHELRTPLTHIKGFASSLLQEDVEFEERSRIDFLQTIDQEADRLARLVNDLLEMSRLPSHSLPLELEPTAPDSIVASGVKRAEPYLQKHSVVVDAPPRLPLLSLDRARIERTLINLLENAAKYSPEGGAIEVRAEGWGCPSPAEVVFSVTDQGFGIPEESREAVFEKFTRLQSTGVRQPPGTGLGLAMCKSIVEAHGGRIWVEGSPDRGGARFLFSIPVSPRLPADQAPSPSTSPPERHHPLP